MGFGRSFGQQSIEKKPKREEKVCKRIIRRDKDGRIKEERFEGCSKEEMRMFRDNDSDKE